MNSTTFLRTVKLFSLSLVTVVAVACGSIEPSPTAPTPEPAPAPAPAPEPAPEPAPAPAPAPSGPGRLEVRIDPNPVPWSSEAVAGCSLANRWHYDQILKNAGGTRMTISDRTDLFDGAQVSSRTGLGIVLTPGQETTIRTRWCSANNIEHRAQTNFSGSDDAGNRITFTGPTVRLMPR
jgi:hypothetical protein